VVVVGFPTEAIDSLSILTAKYIHKVFLLKTL
jgi:hypothetical protein